MKTTWIISDTHFNHQFMIDKGIRDINYQQRIITNWKICVDKDDTVIHLGDVIFNNASEVTEILKDLPGYKILVRGNHDKNSNNWYLTHGFNEVHNSYTVTTGDGKVVLLTHAPSEVKGTTYNICGHLHDYMKDGGIHHKDTYKYMGINTRIYSAELENYYPKTISYMIDIHHASHEFILKHGPLGMRTSIIFNKIGRGIRKGIKYVTDNIYYDNNN